MFQNSPKYGLLTREALLGTVRIPESFSGYKLVSRAPQDNLVPSGYIFRMIWTKTLSLNLN